MNRNPIGLSRHNGGYWREVTEGEYQQLVAHNAELNEEARRERAERLAEEKRQAAAAAGKRRSEEVRKHLAGVRASMRLGFPGSDEEFEKLWPELKKQYQIDVMRGYDPLLGKQHDPDYGL